MVAGASFAMSELFFSHRHRAPFLPVVRAEAAHAFDPGRLRSLWDGRWFVGRRRADRA